MEKESKLTILTRGLIKENPTLVLLLGTCPFLATSTSALNGAGMGLSTTAVLVCSNIVIALLKNVIPEKVRIPCYIVVIAGIRNRRSVSPAGIPAEPERFSGIIYSAHRSKLYHSRKSRDVRQQTFCHRFRAGRYRNGPRLYSRSLLHGRYP